MEKLGFRILLVDDEVDLLRPLQKNLELFDYQVNIASGGNEASVLFLKEDFDIIITDMNMPEGDGGSLLRKIKAVDINFPVICFLTNSSSEAIAEIYRQGADAILSKPFEFSVLVGTIDRILKSDGKKWLNSPNYENSLGTFTFREGIEFGRSGFSAQAVCSGFPGVGSLLRYTVVHPELGQISGVGWVRWKKNREDRIGVEIASVREGREKALAWVQKERDVRFIP